ncbi:MAG: cupredoxin domain-containing protein [Candidatus Diapherotrites archaeon]|nr:cupredoxin domain-containing protein [Candidatus Diapherotrites archaeon]
MNEVKVQRVFLLLVLGALVVFGGMVLFWFGANAAPARSASVNNQGIVAGGNGQAQDIYIRALSSGTYDKSEVTVKKGVPVRLHFSADPGAGCGRYLVLYGLNVNALSKNGEEAVVDFTPQQEGSFEYNCGMRMFKPGTLKVLA